MKTFVRKRFQIKTSVTRKKNVRFVTLRRLTDRSKQRKLSAGQRPPVALSQEKFVFPAFHTHTHKQRFQPCQNLKKFFLQLTSEYIQWRTRGGFSPSQHDHLS